MARKTGSLTVKVADSIFDGEGSFLEIGTAFDAVDGEAAADLLAKGLAE